MCLFPLTNAAFAGVQILQWKRLSEPWHTDVHARWGWGGVCRTVVDESAYTLTLASQIVPKIIWSLLDLCPWWNTHKRTTSCFVVTQLTRGGTSGFSKQKWTFVPQHVQTCSTAFTRQPHFLLACHSSNLGLEKPTSQNISGYNPL